MPRVKVNEVNGMFRVTVIGLNEVLEFEIQAQGFTADGRNNLVLEDEDHEVAMFHVNRWIGVEQVDTEE